MAAFAGCSRSDKSDHAADNGAAPVLIGMIHMEQAGRETLKDMRRGTEAAIRYFNAERGGLRGHPVELRACTTAGAPESSVRCAHQMVEQHVVAVRGGVDLGSAASLPILKAAGIPYVGYQPLTPSDFTSDEAFTLVPGGVGNAATAYYLASTRKAKRVAILQADDVAGKNLAGAFVKPALLRAGVPAEGITSHSEKTEAADLTSVVQAALQTKPDVIIVVFPPPACARIMRAAGQLRVSVPMAYIEACSDPAVLRAGGAGADGAYFNGSYLSTRANASDEDVKLLRAKLARYGDGLAPSSDAIAGFATSLTVLNRLAAVDGDLTPASVTSAFRSAKDAPGFMTHAYTCDGKQSLPPFVSVCNSYVRVYQYKSGTLRDVLHRWVSASEPLRP
jgi:branched-chain amino acid transport system substrate-binding protein